ncbi:MAG: Rieske 2Fe-2S domain-containing protein [Actinobacteria bacterium]|nr:Rieske 2Fe-2S domain-containing protein [Actinomycetota bacterium]
MNLHPRALVERIEPMEGLDGPGRALGAAVDSVIRPGSLKDLLSGSWLGHPIHPVLTDVVIGAWSGAMFLDVLGGRKARGAADSLVGLGILAAVPTAITGLNDWNDTDGETRRVGLVHGAGNAVALSLHLLSLRARRRGARARGFLLSTLGMGVATFTAYLGGHLVYSRAVGVDMTALEKRPHDWIPVGALASIPENELTSARAGNADVLLVRRGQRVFALSNTCSHRGCPLSEGSMDPENGSVTCGCHGSMFRLSDGEVLRGPATAPQPAYQVRMREGVVEVRMPARS